MPTHDRYTAARGRTRIVRPLAVCFVAVLLLGVVVAGAASAQPSGDSLEVNDNRSTATQLGTDGSDTGLTVNDTDEDYFAVSAAPGDTVSANLTADGDSNLTVLGPNGSVLASSASTSVATSVTENDTHYVRVAAANDASVQYDITVNTTDDSPEPNDERATATEVENGSATDEAIIDGPRDVDYYAVEADAGDTVVSEIGFDSDSADLDLELENDTGATLETSNYGTDSERVVHEVDENGTYYVRVDAYGGAPAAYTYAVNTTDSAPPATEPGGFDSDAAANGTQLESDDSLTNRTLADSDAVDYYAVGAAPGERITATMSFPSSADLDLELRDGSGELLRTSYHGTGSERLSYTVERGGRYYVLASAHSGVPADYDLTVDTTAANTTADAFEPNDDHSGAPTVTGFDSYSALTIADSEDVDYFAVDADAGDTITATISHPSSADLDLVVEDVTGTALQMSYYGTDSERIDYEVDSTGTYYVRVQAFDGAPADYNISVGTGADSDPAGIENGTDLRAIELGETASGTVDRSDPTADEHVHEPVAFDGQRGENVSLTLAADSARTYLVLRDPLGEYVAAAESDPGSEAATIEGHTLETTGQYTVLATSVSGDETFDYRLSLSAGGEGSADATRETANPQAANASQATETTDSGASGPGFGAVAAVVAVLAAALVARARR